MTTHSTQPTAANQPAGPALRSTAGAGLLAIVAGAVQGDGALITAAHRNSSPVSDDQLSYVIAHGLSLVGYDAALDDPISVAVMSWLASALCTPRSA
jgi:hypothetical protein